MTFVEAGGLLVRQAGGLLVRPAGGWGPFGEACWRPAGEAGALLVRPVGEACWRLDDFWRGWGPSGEAAGGLLVRPTGGWGPSTVHLHVMHCAFW